MNKKNLVFIVFAIIIAITIYFIVSGIKNTRDIVIKPEAEAVPEELKEPVIHAIPGNRIPSEEEIRKNIAVSEVRKDERQKIAAKKTAAVAAAAAAERPQETAPEVKKSAVKTGALPAKKKVKFPTYEERQKKNPQSVIVAY